MTIREGRAILPHVPRPRIIDRDYLTTTQVAKVLRLSVDTLRRYIDAAILPHATLHKTNGLRLFDADWLNYAKIKLRIKPEEKE